MASYVRQYTFTDGNLLTGAQLEGEFNAVKGALDAIEGAAVSAGTITTTALASPQAYFTITVPCIKDTDALSSTVLATAEAGLGNGYTDSATSARFNFSISHNCTLIAVEASCQDAVSAGATRNNDAVLRQNAALVGATRTQFPDGGGSNRTTGLSTALLATDTLQISCETDSAGTDGVVGGFVVLHLQTAHRAAP